MILLTVDLPSLLFTTVGIALAAAVVITITRRHDRKRFAGSQALVIELSASGPMTLDQIARFMSEHGHGDGNYTWMAVRDLILAGVLEWPESPTTGLFRLADADREARAS